MRTLLLALLLASCASDSIWWDLPSDMTDDERAAFGEGIELDNEIAIRQQFIAQPGDGNHRVILRRPENMANGIDANGETGLGVMNLARGQSHRTLVVVVAHEGLHAAGVRTHHDERGIMNAHGLTLDAGEPIAWTDADVEHCRRAGACR